MTFPPFMNRAFLMIIGFLSIMAHFSNSLHADSWIRTYGKTNGDYYGPIRQTSDGGFILAGYSASFGSGGYNLWVLKLDDDGKILWQKTYGGGQFEFTSSVRETTDGGLIVTGNTNSFGAWGYDLWVLRLDGNHELCAGGLTRN